MVEEQYLYCFFPLTLREQRTIRMLAEPVDGVLQYFFGVLDLALGFTEAAYKRAPFQDGSGGSLQSSINTGEKKSMNRLPWRVAGW